MTADQTVLSTARRVIALEGAAIHALMERIDDSFYKAVKLIVDGQGRVIVCGVGKSGLIGRKIAATLTSTGTPASFLHPTEGVHGDLGIVTAQDVIILLSKSGESEEVLTVLSHLKRFGAHTIAMTGNIRSTLARESSAVLDVSVAEEACPHDLAPTTSTTAALVMGDALAVAVLEQKGFRREDFARLHPGGSLGRQLHVRAGDLLDAAPLTMIDGNATLRDAIMILASRRGLVMVGTPDRLEGVFTAGDLARVMQREAEPFSMRIADVMTRSPQTAQAEELASAVVYRMEQIGIMAMPVLNGENQIVGVVHLHDLMRAGVA